MANQNFLTNRNINESNSLVDLMEHIGSHEDGCNLIEHSLYYSDQQFCKLIQQQKGAVRILNLNCGGLRAKLDKLKIFLTICNHVCLPISVIALQETHICSNTDLTQFELHDYTLISDIARINSFGGVAFYVHNSFSFSKLSNEMFNPSSKIYESMFIELYNNEHKYKKYIIGNIYRRPSELVDEITQFIHEFSQVLHNVHGISKRTYIAGDFNIDLLSLRTNQYYTMFYDTVTSHGFFPKITRPTRLGNSEKSFSLIDNIFTNNITKTHTSGVLIHQVSDHLLNFTILEDDITHKFNQTRFIEVEQLNPQSLINFKISIAKENIINKIDTSPLANPSRNYNILSTILTSSKHKHLPKKRKKFNKRKHKKEKWMTDNLLLLINQKNDMYTAWKQETNLDNYNKLKTNFKAFEKIVDAEKENAKQQYYYNTFQAQKNDMKKTWATINETLNRGKNKHELPDEFTVNGITVNNPNEIANSFNLFFIDIGHQLSLKLQPTEGHFGDYLNNPTNARFNFSEIAETDTLTIINNLKNKNSSGFDEISNKILKTIRHEICKPLTIIINQSLLTGIFPDALKISKVKPIYKKGDESSLNNYRPISVLPTISKVIERVMYNQLYMYFNCNNLLCEQQYGFRPKHSTEYAAVKLVDRIINNMDNNKTKLTPVAIFMDLSKAFDTLNFDIFLTKIHYYGIRGTALNLIQNYLTTRQQYVEFKNCISTRQNVITGIPQGSILGPLFFSIYINDIIHSTNKFNYLMYADDTTLYFNLEDFPEQGRELDINNELNKVNNWLTLNKLTLNTDKTKTMFFHKRREIQTINFRINNNIIDCVSSFTYLGLILDEHLSWNNHIAMITSKISRVSGVLQRLKYIYPLNILKIIYNSLFTPHINYGIFVWGTHVNQLSKYQKKAIRAITNSDYIAHTEPLLKNLSILKVEDMYTLKLLKFLHNLSHNNLPPYFSEYNPHLVKLETPYYLRTHPLPVPAITHVYAESSLIYQLVKLKNAVTLNNKLIIDKIENRTHSHQGFSKYVTTSILRGYSYDCILLHCRTCNRNAI